ncbi:MAG: Pyridoxal phosphate homeostasis protein [Phycisphaerales bacterium]|nr:Pyridoxal phosphate homeostasis protein [Phycisphaerales bacterium]MCK6477343.1 YggS family pyridoxal phosphate-dependent enzyme [Phycisphaerales bacterium]
MSGHIPQTPDRSTPQAGGGSAAGELAERYAAVCDRVARAAARSGRTAADIIVVAVTKFADADQIRAMIDLGHRDFGENRVQVLMQHAAMVEEYFARLRVMPSAARQDLAGGRLLSAVRSRQTGASTGSTGGKTASGPSPAQASGVANPVRWHLIGHLQRNKARKALEFVRLVHSVDSLRLAEELQIAANRREEPVDVLLQVNCSGEDSKFGCPVPAALPLAEQIDTMTNVRVRGLMTMAPLTDRPEETRHVFRRCRELFDEARREGIGGGMFNILSMGMSGDFEVAIEEGANVVRVGTAIFGEPRTTEADLAESDSSEG